VPHGYLCRATCGRTLHDRIAVLVSAAADRALRRLREIFVPGIRMRVRQIYIGGRPGTPAFGFGTWLLATRQIYRVHARRSTKVVRSNEPPSNHRLKRNASLRTETIGHILGLSSPSSSPSWQSRHWEDALQQFDIERRRTVVALFPSRRRRQGECCSCQFSGLSQFIH